LVFCQEITLKNSKKQMGTDMKKCISIWQWGLGCIKSDEQKEQFERRYWLKGPGTNKIPI